MTTEYRNPSHWKHVLELKEYLKPYICNDWKEVGSKSRYRCEKCNFDLHSECMFPQTSQFRHEFFPSSTFEFLTTPTKASQNYSKRQCDACRMDVHGFVFHCKKNNLNLHPYCGNLEKKHLLKKAEHDDDEEIVFNLYDKMQEKCMWCKRESIKDGNHKHGWSYISGCGKYHIHVACVTHTALEAWKDRKDTNDI